MIKKLLLIGLIIFGGFLFLNITARPAFAAAPCYDAGDGCSFVPEPGGGTGFNVTSKAPASNGVAWKPSTVGSCIATNYPCSQTFQGDHHMFFVIGNDKAYPYDTVKIPILVSQGDQISLTIHNAGPNCNGADRGPWDRGGWAGANGSRGGPDFASNSPDGNGGPATTFNLAGSPFKSNPYNQSQSVGTMAGCDVERTFNIGIASKGYDLKGIEKIGTFLYKFILKAQVVPGTTKGENSFWIETNVTNSGRTAPVALGNDEKIGLGFRAVNLANGNYWTAQIGVGARETCETYYGKTQGAISYFDTDPNGSSSFDGTKWNPAIKLKLQSAPRGTNTTWNDVATITHQDLLNNPDGTLYSGSFNNNLKYRILLMNIGPKNTIFITISGGISQAGGSFYLRPQDCATCTTSPSTIESGKTSTITVTGTYEAKEDTWPASFYIRRYGNANHGYANLTTAKTTNTPGPVTGTDTVTPTAPDTYSYFVASSNPAYTSNGLAGGPVFGDFSGCKVTVGNPPSTVVVTCTIEESDDVEPGQTDPTLYRVVLNAQGNGAGGPYKVKVTAIPGAYVTDPDNPRSVTIDDNPGPDPGKNYPLTFEGHLDYEGSFSATVTDQTGKVVDTCPGDHPVHPSTRPYFKVYRGDISTGGGFKDANGNCNNTGGMPYISPYDGSNNYTKIQNVDSGGLRAFSDPTSKGSSASFGVDALGEIYKSSDPTLYMGFYSRSNILLANNIADQPKTSMGGYLNYNSQAHCVIDFYDSTRTSDSLPTFSGGSVSGLSSNQYQASSGVNIGASTISAGKQITIYVDGDVTISGDIKNADNWDATDPKNVPFLTIVARGNITLMPGVSQIDGLFIAQPIVPGGDTNNYTKGQFNTCRAGDLCASQLIVNGAVIAQEVHLLRANGTLNGSIPPLTTNPAEIFYYSPAMVMGVPNFSQSQSLSSIFEGLFSLPPVF